MLAAGEKRFYSSSLLPLLDLKSFYITLKMNREVIESDTNASLVPVLDPF